jgi:hypothetical protein
MIESCHMKEQPWHDAELLPKINVKDGIVSSRLVPKVHGCVNGAANVSRADTYGKPAHCLSALT